MESREREVRRKIANQEFYRDADPGLEALEEKRLRGMELAHDFNNTGPRETAKRQQLLAAMPGGTMPRAPTRHDARDQSQK